MSKPKTGNPKQPKEMFDIKRAGAKELWRQWSVEKDIQDQQDKNQVEQSDLDLAYGQIDKIPEDNNIHIKEVSKSDSADWEHLKRIARVKFPEGTKIMGLSPMNRLVAIAWCLGWSTDKISKASGVAKSTIHSWIHKRPDIQLFIDQFNLKIGVGDIIKNEFGALEYNGIQVVKSLLEDRSTPSGVRLDAVKWIFERNRGKPNQNIEVKGNLLKDLIQAVGRETIKELSNEEEEALFKSSKQTN